MKTAMALLAVCGLAAAASAQWIEIPDAGPFVPGQITVGVGPLLTITGGPDFIGDKEDLYCIYIYDVPGFSATTIGGAGFDTQLWLFESSSAMGVTFNDDSGFTFQSTITGAFVPGPGWYTIGISPYDNDALNPGGLPIWADGPFGVERAPDGPGAPGPLAGWDGFSGDLAPYTIFLTGATYCIPTPGVLGVLGLAGLAAFRRRR